MSEHDEAPVVVGVVTVESNGLGLAGFIVSLVGFLSCGLISPIGLIMSLVALRNRPKGLAIAGVVLGALGSCGIIITILFFPAVIMMMLAAVGAAAAFPQFEAQLDMARIDVEIRQYEDRTGALPLSLDDLSIPDAEMLTDPWDNPYVYELGENGMTFRLFSAGEDGTPGSGDDLEMDS